LEALYPLIVFDAIRIKAHDEGIMRNKAVYVALGVQPNEIKKIFGSNRARAQISGMNERKSSDVENIRIAIAER
jgi:putative transposase